MLQAKVLTIPPEALVYRVSGATKGSYSEGDASLCNGTYRYFAIIRNKPAYKNEFGAVISRLGHVWHVWDSWERR